MREFLCGDVFDPHVGLIGAAIVLAPIDLALWVVGDALAVRRVAGLVPHVRARAPLRAAIDARHIKQRHKIFAAVAGEQHAPRIGRPTQHRVISRMKSQLPGNTAFSRNDKDVQVAIPITGKRNPLPIRRKSRVRIACFIDRQALNILSVLIGSPDVTEISKRHPAVVITRISNQFRLATESKRGQRENKQKGDCWVESSHGLAPVSINSNV